MMTIGTVVVHDVLMRQDSVRTPLSASVEVYDAMYNLIAMFFGDEARNEAVGYIVRDPTDRKFYLRNGDGPLEEF